MHAPSDLLQLVWIFLLATLVGLDVIRKISPLLHTPLMSLTNAISAITIVGAILVTGHNSSPLAVTLGVIAVAAASINIVGGYMITYRMLKMFRKREKQR